MLKIEGTDKGNGFLAKEKISSKNVIPKLQEVQNESFYKSDS